MAYKKSVLDTNWFASLAVIALVAIIAVCYIQVGNTPKLTFNKFDHVVKIEADGKVFTKNSPGFDNLVKKYRANGYEKVYNGRLDEKP
jgi:uncharacterized protein YxeA